MFGCGVSVLVCEKGHDMVSIYYNKVVVKGGCAHFDMYNFHSNLIDLYPKTHFVQLYLKFIFIFSP